MKHIALEIIINPPTYFMPPEKERLRPVFGEVIDIKPATRFGKGDQTGPQIKFATRGAVGMPRTGYIFVTNVPDNINIEKLTAELTNPYMNPVSVEPDQIRSKKWNISEIDLPAGALTQLQTVRQTNITWGEFKACLQKRVVTDQSDHTIDAFEIGNVTDDVFS